MIPIIFTDMNKKRTMILPDKIVSIKEKESGTTITTVRGVLNASQDFDTVINLYNDSMKHK